MMPRGSADVRGEQLAALDAECHALLTSPKVSRLIERAQAKGEVRAGDPRLHAFTLMGPMMMGVLWRETLQPVGGAPLDLEALAKQHAETVLGGLLK